MKEKSLEKKKKIYINTRESNAGKTYQINHSLYQMIWLSCFGAVKK
jgi:hypothetical protein